MNEIKMYPVLGMHDYDFKKSGVSRELFDQCPRSIPWSLLAPHENQALRNHNQSLQRLAERGGLSPVEMWFVLNDKYLTHSSKPTNEQAIRYLIEVSRGSEPIQSGSGL